MSFSFFFFDKVNFFVEPCFALLKPGFGHFGLVNRLIYIIDLFTFANKK